MPHDELEDQLTVICQLHDVCPAVPNIEKLRQVSERRTRSTRQELSRDFLNFFCFAQAVLQRHVEEGAAVESLLLDLCRHFGLHTPSDNVEQVRKVACILPFLIINQLLVFQPFFLFQPKGVIVLGSRRPCDGCIYPLVVAVG